MTSWPPKLELVGVLVSRAELDTAVEAIVAAAGRRDSAVVSCHAVHAIVTAARDPSLKAMVNQFDMVTADGQPVRWGLNLLHRTGLKRRVYGPELMLRVCERAAELGLSIYLYGGTEEVAEVLPKRLREQFPELKIAGSESPPFRPLSAEEDRELIARVNESGATMMFVGLGCPKQDIFAFDHMNKLKTVIVCSGAAFDFHAGVKPMAPTWMQKRGLEWLFRLGCEPRRLWKRYLTTNTLYVLMLLKAFILQSLALKRRKMNVENSGA